MRNLDVEMVHLQCPHCPFLHRKGTFQSLLPFPVLNQKLISENRMVVVRDCREWEMRWHRSKQMFSYKKKLWASLVAQWLRIHLLMQGTRVWALVQEDPTCRGATKPVSHNYWACALKPASHNYWACVPQPLKPVRLDPMLHNKRSHRNEKPAHQNEEQPSLASN